MSLLIQTQTIPLATDEDGIIRVSRTRVTLDTIVHSFEDGATAEEIAQQYPSVPLADIYSVISYYLRQSDEIKRYLEQRRREGEQIRQQNESRFDPIGLRDRLLARQASEQA